MANKKKKISKKPKKKKLLFRFHKTILNQRIMKIKKINSII